MEGLIGEDVEVVKVVANMFSWNGHMEGSGQIRDTGMSGGIARLGQEFAGIAAHSNSRVMGGGKGGDRFKAVAVQCHLDKIFGG